MRKVYWRPQGISESVLLLLAVISLVSLLTVEFFQAEARQPAYQEKMTASLLALEAFQTVKEERLRRDPDLVLEADPAESGLIGQLISPVTSNTGKLEAKQTSVNPNFAAVFVHLLYRAGVEEGDVVAMGPSGSFPALNICAYAALKTMGARPIIISSISASQWGANDPEFLWIDMEKVLYERGIFPFRSLAASIGGIEDKGLGMPLEGRRLISERIQESGVPLLKPKNYEDSIEKRMNLYREAAGELPIKCYISIGGGTVSVGTKVGKTLFHSGLNYRLPPGAVAIDSVMARFSSEGLPVIHMVNIDRLATEYGFPLQPTSVPSVGVGTVFVRRQYNPYLAGGSLALIFFALYAFIRSEWGHLIIHSLPRRKAGGHIEPSI